MSLGLGGKGLDIGFSPGLVGSRGLMYGVEGSGKREKYLKVDLTCVKHLTALDKRKKNTLHQK